MDERYSSSFTMCGLALLLAAFSACSDKPDDSIKALAIINGKEITAGEFDVRWSQLPEFTRKTYAGLDGRRKFLDELIMRELLLQEARRRGLDRDRALVERVERFKERSLLDELVREEVDAGITITLEQMTAYYAANTGSFLAPVPAPLRAGRVPVIEVLPFEAVKDQIQEQLLMEQKRQRFDALVALLRAQAKLRVADVPIPMSELPSTAPASGSP